MIFLLGRFLSLKQEHLKLKKKKKAEESPWIENADQKIRSQSKNIQNSIEGNNYVIIFETVT